MAVGVAAERLLCDPCCAVQHDAFCVAATVHALLLGAYIDVQAAQPLVGGPAAKPVYRPCTAVPASNPRKALWDRVLRALLNCPLPPERPDVTPLISQLSAVRPRPHTCMRTTIRTHGIVRVRACMRRFDVGVMCSLR